MKREILAASHGDGGGGRGDPMCHPEYRILINHEIIRSRLASNKFTTPRDFPPGQINLAVSMRRRGRDAPPDQSDEASGHQTANYKTSAKLRQDRKKRN